MPQPIEIEGPDGTIYEFPEGTSRDVMRQAMARVYSGGGQAPPPPPPVRRTETPPVPGAAPQAPPQAPTAPPPPRFAEAPDWNGQLTLEDYIAAGATPEEARVLMAGASPDTYNGNAIVYQGQQPAETMPTGGADRRSPSGLRPITGEVMDPITGGTREQPIDLDALWQQNPALFTAMGEGFRGQYARDPSGAARQIRDIGTPSGDIGPPQQVGPAGIPYYDSNEGMERMGAFAQALTEQVPFGMDYVAGITGALTGEGYSNTRDLLDDAAEEQRMFNPNLRRAGGVTGFGAGLVLTPGGSYIGRGATGAERALRAGQIGGAAGAVYGGGTGRGDAEERLSRALLTSAAGAGGGVAGQRLADVLAPQAARLGEQIRPLLSSAEQRVQGVISRGLGRDRVSPGDALARLDEGALPYEIGDNLTATAEAVRQSPGPGNPIVGQAVTDRVGGVSGRVRGEISQAVGGANKYFAEMNRLRGARQTAAREGMAAFGQTEVPLSPEAIRAIRSPLSTRAVRDEALNALSDVSPDAGAAANRLFGLGDEALDNPAAVRLTVQEAQDISFALREAATRAYRGGFGARGERLQAMADAIRGSARDTVPEYGAWLQRYADDSEVMNALELGRNALNGGMGNNAENIALQIANLSDEGRGYFQEGVGEALLARTRVAGGPRAVRELLRNDEFQDILRLAIPDEAAYDNFINVMTREADIADRGGRIMAGPPTAQRHATQADLAGQSMAPKVAEFATATGAGAAVGGPAGAIGGGLGMLARELVKGLGQRGRERASVWTNDETNRLLAEVLTDPDRFRDLISRAQAREQIPGFSRQASAQIADVLSRRAGPLAEQATDPFASQDRKRAHQ